MSGGIHSTLTYVPFSGGFKALVEPINWLFFVKQLYTFILYMLLFLGAAVSVGKSIYVYS